MKWVFANIQLPALQERVILRHLSGKKYFGNFDKNEEGVWLYIHSSESHEGWTVEDSGTNLTYWQWLSESSSPCQCERYREVLEKIANPIAAFRKELKEGEQLNGEYAIRLSNDANYLKKLASDALEAPL